MMQVGQLRTALGRRPGATGLLTDFDGTLAPIVPDPSAARPFPGSVESLASLARHYQRVAVISGRPLAYLDPLVPSEIDIAALYGLELREGGHRSEHPDASRWRPTVTGAVVAAEAHFAGWPGINVEAKGLSLTVHYRNATAPNSEVEVRRWAQDQERHTGLLAQAAKASVELHPPVAADKGTVLQRWAQGCPVVAFFGDDRGDLSAFRALRTISQEHGSEGYAVAVASLDTPREVTDAADAVLDGPAELASLLAALVTDLGPG